MKKTIDDVLPMIISDIDKMIDELRNTPRTEMSWATYGAGIALHRARDLVESYVTRIKAERREALDELTREAQELGLYDMDKGEETE